MKEAILTVLVGTFGIVGIIYAAVTNADVKGYTDVHGCTGECYERYTAKYGTFSEQLEAKRVAMQMESPADKGGKLYVNCNIFRYNLPHYLPHFLGAESSFFEIFLK